MSWLLIILDGLSCTPPSPGAAIQVEGVIRAINSAKNVRNPDNIKTANFVR